MREYIGIFRGKRKDNNEWVEGYLLYDEENGEAFIACSFEDRSAYIREVDPDTIGECTSMKDKNGRLIYEGDILKFDYIGRNRGVYGETSVEFCNGKFGVFWGWHRDFVTLDGFANTTLEIIGNVIDNPELLKGGEG